MQNMSAPRPPHVSLLASTQVPEQCNVSALRAPSDNSPGPLGGWMIAAGMTNGNVLLYDARERGVSAVHKMMRLRNYVVDLFFPEVCAAE